MTFAAARDAALRSLRTDHVAGAAAILAGVIVYAASGDLPAGSFSFPGAGMLPKLLCILLILFGVVLILRARDSEPFVAIDWRDTRHALYVLATTAAIVLYYTTLGFIVSMALLLFVLVAGERKNIVLAALYGVGVSVATYALFTNLLKSPLERGLFWF